jgi:rifampicin phosphotransferase
MNHIRWFQEISAAESGQVGGKGANLGELTRAGLPVPPGFCVTAAVYQAFLESTGLDGLIESKLAGIDLDSHEDLQDKSTQIQEAINAQPIPPGVADEVASSASQLLADAGVPEAVALPLAVRSSATAEDQANASFAGQLETYLNIRGLPALLKHIKLCWASLWTERMITYIANQGLDHHSVSMSVVVQRMIPSEASGVLFTANPVTGKRDEVVINASWGLGEAIVSGLVTPDTITARKSDGHVLTRQTAVKDSLVAYAPGGGTEVMAVPSHLRATPVLSDQQVQELTRLARQIEDYYGKPQDIEWGRYQGQWYLLQSRPITTLAQVPERRYPVGEFNRSMFIEIFPDPLSPVFLSVVAPLFKDMLDFTFQNLGFKPAKSLQAIGVFYNQPYFNRDYIAAAFQPLTPPAREPVIAQVINPFGSNAEAASVEFSLPYLRMAACILRFMALFPRQLPGLITTYRAEIAQAEVFPFQTATDAEICKVIRRIPFEYANKLLNYDFLMIAVIGRTYRLLGALLKRFYGADTNEIVAKLISGVTGNVTMETNKRLWDLAQIAKKSQVVGDALRDNDLLQARQILQQSTDGRGFLHELDRFLSEFGHREVHMDIMYPTWNEDPQPVFSFIRSYLDADESQSPYRQQERLVREREQLTQMVVKDIEKSLGGRFLLGPIFKWILNATQIHTRERDTMHFEMTRLFPPIRRLMLELGRRWKAAGMLDQEEDIFYLSLDEMDDIARSAHPVQETVRSRKDEFAHNQNCAWPIIIRHGEEQFVNEAATGTAGESGLQGVAGSPGKVIGISRVVQGPQDFSKLKKGEILVAPITNPVWTPLFAIAGGVVTEVGGILSHGAIVAREYGIPAVMSVQGATKKLRDGQRVAVDGNKGMVYLES